VGTSLTGGEHRSDRCATTQSGDFEAEDTRRDRMACIEATQGAVARHPSDGEDMKTSKSALEGLEGPTRRTREGGSEWEPIKILLEGDGNSDKMKAASNTLLQLTTQVGQAHVDTEVPLDQGTNTQPSDPRTQRNTKPRVYRPTPVRPVSTTGQTGPCW
jgi:hypothetical protein